MLGLATHELFISLLQEINMGKSLNVGAMNVADINHVFQVLHFELLRDYLKMEFEECQTEMLFKFDIDRIADDWVLLCMLIGNDYLPGLQNFDFRIDVLSVICDAYKEILPTMKNYINESGHLDTARFSKLIEALKRKDFDMYHELNLIKLSKQMESTSVGEHKVIEPAEVKSADNDLEYQIIYSGFMDAREHYYQNNSLIEKSINFVDLTNNYIKTIQWVLFYYFRGTYSWSFYYPYNFAPFVSDLTSFDSTGYSFEIDGPVSPLNHLLAVLPKDSFQSCDLPMCYRSSIELNSHATDADAFVDKVISDVRSLVYVKQ